MKLVSFDAKLWDVFSGAYGNVCKEVKILMGEEKPASPQRKLRRLDIRERDEEQIAFDNLCENLYHQMSFYPAFYLVLPYIIMFLGEKEAEGDFEWQLAILTEMGICLATDIPANTGQKLDKGEIWESYQASVGILQEKTKLFLQGYKERIKVLDSNRKNALITSVMAILGSREMAYLLVLSGWEECYLLCGQCEYCYEEAGLEDLELCRRITPALAGLCEEKFYTWYSSFLQEIDGVREAELMSYYYGVFTCPECGNRQPVLEVMKNYYLGYG